MSMQSDVEMLSIRALEEYADKSGLTSAKTVALFNKHQIFEKIILQHEYLHQVSFEEVMEFIYKSMEETKKELIVFHGTTADFDKIELSKSRNRRDFGTGFYTTILESQSKEWAYRLSLREHKNIYYVYNYIFEESDVLKIRRFETLNQEWLEFVKENRLKGGLQHDYDVVIGPVADDNTMETVQLYVTGILSVDEAVSRLKYSKVNNQVSFHTEKALQHLKFIRRESYE